VPGLYPSERLLGELSQAECIKDSLLGELSQAECIKDSLGTSQDDEKNDDNSKAGATTRAGM